MAELSFDFTNLPPTSLRSPKSHPAPERPPGAPQLLEELDRFGLAGEVVGTILPWTEADPAALLLDFMTTFGSAVGPGPHMYVGDETHEPKLFTVIVGETAAGRKGTSRAAIRRVFERAQPEWAHENELTGLSSGEGLIQAMADMDGSKNVLDVETEFAKVLTVAGRQGNTLDALIRQLWEGSRVRILNRKATRLDDAFFSLIGHVTEFELRAKLSEVDQVSGFANRILWTYAHRSKLLPAGGRIPDEVLLPLARRVRRAICRARRLREMDRTVGAAREWERTYIRMADSRLPGLLGAVTDRREAQSVRLALLFAAMDGRRKIQPSHVRAASGVWSYCQESAAYVFGDTLGDPRADKVLTALRTAEGGELKRSVIRADVLRDHVKRPELDAIRDLLVKAERVEVETEATEGRAAELWRLK
ncbi:MAG: DUF3987 domain-containing protein [Thermoleophilaceae bacterium]